MIRHTLNWVDYSVLVSFIVISLGIGVYHSLTGGRQKTTQEFFSANRQLSVIPTALSMLASFQSAIIFLASTAELYMFGPSFVSGLIPSLSLGLILTERLIVPWMYSHKFVSINEVSTSFLYYNGISKKFLALFSYLCYYLKVHLFRHCYLGPRSDFDFLERTIFQSIYRNETKTNKQDKWIRFLNYGLRVLQKVQ
jgi:hypothetical protein